MCAIRRGTNSNIVITFFNYLKLNDMTDEKKIIKGLDKELMQLINAEMNDPVIGKLLNRNAAYVLGKEIKLVLIERACKWLKNYAHIYVSETTGDLNEDDLINAFRKAMKGGEE